MESDDSWSPDSSYYDDDSRGSNMASFALDENMQSVEDDYNSSPNLHPLFAAVVQDKVDDIISHLSQPMASVNFRNKCDGNTALHVAVLTQKFQAFNYLLTAEGIDLDARNYEGETPLHVACLWYCAEYFTTKLIQAGANINLLALLAKTPLHYGCTSPHSCEITKILVESGADLDVEDMTRNTPLSLVCRRCMDCAYMLLYYNVDVTIGTSALFEAANCNFPDDYKEAFFNYFFDKFNTTCDLESLEYWYNRGSVVFTLMVNHVSSITYNENCSELQLFRTKFCKFPDRFELLFDKFPSVASDILLSQPGDILKSFVRYLFPSAHERQLNHLRFFYKIASVLYEFWHYLPSSTLSTHVTCFLEIGATIPEDDLIGLVVHFASMGYPVRVNDLCIVYKRYGLCKLFNLLLYIVDDGDVVLEPPSVYCSLLCNINFDVQNVLSGKYGSPTSEVAETVVKYFAGEKVQEFLRLHDQPFSCSGLPSLLELGRNAFRKHLIAVFGIKTPCQFYTYVDRLEIAELFKDVICYRKAIY